jgi:hypothetical protein
MCCNISLKKISKLLRRFEILSLRIASQFYCCPLTFVKGLVAAPPHSPELKGLKPPQTPP